MGREYAGNRESRTYVFMPGQGFIPDVRQNRAIAESVHLQMPGAYHNSARWFGLSACPECGMRLTEKAFKQGGSN